MRKIFCFLIVIFYVFSYAVLADDEHEVGLIYNEVQLRAVGGEAEDADLRKKLEDKANEIKELESKLNEIASTKDTLNNQIGYFNGQIELTQLKVSQTEVQINTLEREINRLSIRIAELDKNLDALSVLLAERIVKTYKQGDVDYLRLFLSARGFSDLFSGYKYIRSIQLNDKRLLLSMEQSKQLFDQQKTLKLEKQNELTALENELAIQTANLSKQKKGKETLLEVTKNDEKKYQQLLASARAEQAAIASAMERALELLKDGTHVDKGVEIALMGNSGAPGCSTAPHLHFEITNKNGVTQNPANYLKSDWNIIWDNLPDERFALTGDWDWPLKNVRLTQGFGYTWWANTGFYNGQPHTGIDMVDTESGVIRAPKSGILFKGSTSCRGSSLNFVAIEHDDVISWYWHVK